MGSLYYDLVGILRGAGCTVQENSITKGWQRRARSSGGFSTPPLGVWWHHTASNTTPESDLNWQINACADAPVGNLLLDRNGTYWPVAGGASNCAGKGGPANFSRGTVLTDQGNTGGFQIEVANAGTGQAWPEIQVSEFIRGSNALNAAVGNQPTDVITHAVWAPSRKIDPATATAVQGAWKPRSTNSSGTWNLDDIRAECARRASDTPEPEEADMTDEQAQQLDALFQALVPTQGGFVSPDGASTPLNPPWAALWGYQLTSANVLPTLGTILERLAAVEAKLP